jgi:Spy/CpxP family protein refolding chaperone
MSGAMADSAPESSYVGQQYRDIKSLSADDVKRLLAGEGMGLAKAAELNGYPGPVHVLELASQLSLTSSQLAETEELFRSMEGEAKALGRALVEEERALDQLFTSSRVTSELLATSLNRIGKLQVKLRGVHLEAHLEQRRILTPEQNAQYPELRGYSNGTSHAGHNAHDRH